MNSEGASSLRRSLLSLLYAIISFPPSLELQAALTGALCQCLHAAVINVAAAVEHDFFDALLQSALCDGCTDLLCGFAVAAVAFKCLLNGGGGNEGVSRYVVDDLGIDVAFAAEYAQTGSLGGAGDLAAYSVVALDALCLWYQVS